MEKKNTAQQNPFVKPIEQSSLSVPDKIVADLREECFAGNDWGYASMIGAFVSPSMTFGLASGPNGAYYNYMPIHDPTTEA